MASTSAREIGPAAAGAPAAAPGDADAPADAGVPFDEGGVAAVPVVGVTVAACLEPKMADTILPNTLMLSSRPYFVDKIWSGGKHERVRKYRIGHFWFQTCGDRDADDRDGRDAAFVEGDARVRWGVRISWRGSRRASCGRTDLPRRRRSHPQEAARRSGRRLRLEKVDRRPHEAVEAGQQPRRPQAIGAGARLYRRPRW